jgi:hypothetical protein
MVSRLGRVSRLVPLGEQLGILLQPEHPAAGGQGTGCCSLCESEDEGDRTEWLRGIAGKEKMHF